VVYVALLRGINVGGNNKVDMKKLKQTFEQAGMNKVQTYINTGNIIFTSYGLSHPQLVKRLEEAIHADFQLHIKVVIRSLEEYKIMMQGLPSTWKNDSEMKSDVLFLWDEINEASVLEKLPIKPEIEQVHYVSGAILWSAAREHVTQSGMSKLVGSSIYKQITVRNVNTTRKIYELMLAAAE